MILTYFQNLVLDIKCTINMFSSLFYNLLHSENDAYGLL